MYSFFELFGKMSTFSFPATFFDYYKKAEVCNRTSLRFLLKNNGAVALRNEAVPFNTNLI